MGKDFKNTGPRKQRKNIEKRKLKREREGENSTVGMVAEEGRGRTRGTEWAEVARIGRLQPPWLPLY